MIIIGMNEMGLALGIEAACTCHYPNFVNNPYLKTRITFIDKGAKQKMTSFITRYQYLFELADVHYTEVADEKTHTQKITSFKNNSLAYNDFLDVEFAFVKGDPLSPQVKGLLTDWCAEENRIVTIMVCNDKYDNVLQTALSLSPIVSEKEIPLFVQQNRSSCLVYDLLQKELKNVNLKPFGMVDHCLSLKFDEVEKRAMKLLFIYQTYSYYRRSEQGLNLSMEEALDKLTTLIFPSEETLTALWFTENFEKRWANLHIAKSINTKQRFFAFDQHFRITEDEFSLLSETEHNRWVIERLSAGYRGLTKEEVRNFEQDKKWKEIYKNTKFAHSDIRPFNTLKTNKDNILAHEFDRCLSIGIGLILKINKCS